ncbi:MAG: adenylate/guanylate cyclase domain-containing protein, partial [Alphaproteobacteria bacterium]|nr:adenylate/guanylate cyclase domain-containing protein [Alphaproteobacteria bacterium]
MLDDRVKRRLAAIMMADVAGYGRLMEANEEATLDRLHQHHREFLHPTISRFRGRIFKNTGDALLVEFSSAVEAAQCAVDIQRGMPPRNAGVPGDRHIRLRIGINLGDVIVDGDDLYGDDVNIASRLVSLAQPGGIACSAGIRHQVGSKLGIRFEDQGEKSLKNIAMPVQVYFVGLDQGPAGGNGQRPANGRPLNAPDRPSIAVLPFANMSGDPEQEYFSDGITEDIIIDLSKVSDLFVLSRNAVFRHKASDHSMEQVANDLGVAYLVHGSVRKSGAKVRITAQLIEGASGGHLWADR